MATPVSRRTTRYRLLAPPAGWPPRRRHAGRGRRVPPAHPHPLAVAGTKLLAAETGGTAIDLSSPPTRESIGFLEGHGQPGSG